MGRHEPLINDMFTRVEDQVARIRRINDRKEWGFKDQDFLQALHTAPRWPTGRLAVATLVPYLPAEGDYEGVGRTLIELWDEILEQHAVALCCVARRNAIPSHLRLLQGVEHKPGLRWELINLGGNLCQAPSGIRHPDRSPHAGVIASALQHPEWVKRMNGRTVPYAWVPGYEVFLPERTRTSWGDSLLLQYLKGDAPPYYESPRMEIMNQSSMIRSHERSVPEFI